MSDWAEFCRSQGIDPANPCEFDAWLSQQNEEPRPTQEPLALPTKELLASLANPNCKRCAGTGYLGRYAWNCEGRCFLCLPDDAWKHELDELKAAFDCSMAACRPTSF